MIPYQSERDDFFEIIKQKNGRVRDYELRFEEQFSTRGVGPVCRSAIVRNVANGIYKTYNCNTETPWLQLFERELTLGAFGS